MLERLFIFENEKVNCSCTILQVVAPYPIEFEMVKEICEQSRTLNKCFSFHFTMCQEKVSLLLLFLNRCHNSQLFHRKEVLFPVVALIIFLSIRSLSHSYYSPLPRHQIRSSLRFCSCSNGRNASYTEAEIQDCSTGSLLICFQIPTS